MPRWVRKPAIAILGGFWSLVAFFVLGACWILFLWALSQSKGDLGEIADRSPPPVVVRP